MFGRGAGHFFCLLTPVERVGEKNAFFEGDFHEMTVGATVAPTPSHSMNDICCNCER